MGKENKKSKQNDEHCQDEHCQGEDCQGESCGNAVGQAASQAGSQAGSKGQSCQLVAEDESKIVEELSARVTELTQEVNSVQDKYLRALAELENFKKRAIKERSELLKYQGDRIFIDLVEVVDNFERALAISDQSKEDLRAGLELIFKQLGDLLSRWEVKADNDAVSKPFDPTRQQAISQIVVPDATPGTVIDQVKKAYFYKDKLLRVAEVVVVATPES